MTDLPMPPPDVVDVASAAMARAEYPADVRVPTEDYEAAYYIQAVWPHLYAAALRNAAEAFLTEREQYRQGTGGRTAVLLHRMADETAEWAGPGVTAAEMVEGP